MRPIPFLLPALLTLASLQAVLPAQGVNPTAPLGFLSDPAGVGTVALALPAAPPVLAGLEIFLQAAVLDPTANAVGITLTDAGLAMIR